MSDQIKKPNRIKPELPSGFRDYGPADAIAKQAMIDTIRKTFERFGFDPLETSSVQRTEVLTGGEEDSGKIIFNVKGSQEETSDSSLRFDLTVPLARFMAANPDLPKPFKRYQIGNVWRGERPQQGRYREFLQADVDIVGSSLIDADAEIATIIYTVFKNLGIENFVINYNNRKMLDMLPKFAGFPEEKLWDALRIIDKKDKIGEDGIRGELEKNFSGSIADKILEFLTEDFEPTLQGEGFSEYGKIASMILQSTGCDVDMVNKFFKLERTLVRGLSYYTGSVFEVTLPDAPEIGSVCGGGRYDELVSQFTGQNIPAVGVSFGVDRLFAAMEKIGTLKKKQTLTQVLILQLDANLKDEYLSMAQELRNAGINTALYMGDDSMLKGQLNYALKKEIPYVVICGSREKEKNVVTVKNLATREQQEITREKIVEFFGKQAALCV
ncbi:MAG: histidine--tRNA ligase [Candidatus Sungbacteria bacterium]|nr:histidine--tRNA ligase [Candidatus Sungbacteria bacterium]